MLVNNLKLVWAITLTTALGTAGCAKTTTGDYCDIASPLYFGSEEVVNYLSQHDTILLREIVIHNETQEEICG